MTTPNIARLRLVNQLLLRHGARAPADIVRHLCGIQGQDYSGGEWSIGLRLPGSKLTDIKKAISDGKIVRTWAMRGTLHFLARTDVRWVLELLAPGIILRLARRYRDLDLDSATFKKAESSLAKALDGNRHLTRGELKVIIEKNGISCEGQRMIFILHRASLDRVICFGVTRGKEHTHASFDEWVPTKKRIGREESLAELTRRYFTSHGPATLQDYMWWSGLAATDAKIGLESVRQELVQMVIADKTYWMSAEMEFPKSTSPVVCLLPPFDEYLLGYKERGASIDAAVSKRLRNGGMPDATVMIDGRIVGKWNATFKNDSVVLEARSFRKFTKEEEQAVENAVNRYAEFVGKKLDWSRSLSC